MGGRGGSSGLLGSGGIGKLPELQGSEKQIAWAEDIRKNAIESLSKRENDVLNYEKMKPYSKEKTQTMLFREKMENTINGEYGQFSSVFAGTTSKTAEKLEEIEKRHKSYYVKYAKGTQERKDAYKKARQTTKKEYSKWLVKEYRKILTEKTSAKWWIDRR